VADGIVSETVSTVVFVAGGLYVMAVMVYVPLLPVDPVTANFMPTANAARWSPDIVNVLDPVLTAVML
jgi:hypothetical protein